MHIVEPCDLTNRVANAVGENPTLDSLRAAADYLSSKPGILQARLAFFREHPAWLKSIAAKSYWHQNGFAKVRIVEGRGFCVRMHIWPAGENRKGDADPHGHRWDFASWVATGAGISEKYFTVTGYDEPGAEEYVRCDYSRDADGGHLSEQSKAWLREDGSEDRLQGTVYGCTREVLHTVAPVGDELIATVVVQGPVLADATAVYLRPGQESEVREPRISPQELDALFADVLATVEDSDR